MVNGEKITFAFFNITQRIKVEGKRYLNFGTLFLQPLFNERMNVVYFAKIEQVNKDVNAALSGKKESSVQTY